jgi:hypothetical protein
MESMHGGHHPHLPTYQLPDVSFSILPPSICRYKAKVEEGLSRLLAFLRDEEERERLEEIERLKPIGTPVGAYLEYR